MHTAKIAIHRAARLHFHHEDLEALEIFGRILNDLRQNGQIASSEFPYFNEGDYVCCMVSVFDEHAFHPAHFNLYLKSYIEPLPQDWVKFEIVGRDEAGCMVGSLAAEDALVLYTQAYYVESPIRGLNSFQPIPLYQLPKTDERNQSYLNLIQWQSDYQACDKLQFNCTVGEWFALSQMAELDSELTQAGLAICHALQERIGKPVYYFLFHYYSHDFDHEEQRRCPACGGEWKLEQTLHQRFDFQCHHCRLLSNLAYYPITELLGYAAP